MSNLGRCLPEFLSSSSIFQEDLNSKSNEFKLLKDKLEDLEKQLSINTATWGLSIYERELNINTDLNKSLEDRRSVIRSKWRSSSGKVDWKLIKMVADAYTNGEVLVTFDGRIKIKFTSILGIPENLDDLKKALEEIKPAALRVEYTFAYLLVKDIQVLTLKELDSMLLNKFAGGE